MNNFLKTTSRRSYFVSSGCNNEQPNVGKSTLLDTLIGEDRCELRKRNNKRQVDVPMYIDKTQIVLIDTAGVRKPKSKIELKGIEKTKTQLNRQMWLFMLFKRIKKTSPCGRKRFYYRIQQIRCLQPPSRFKKAISISALKGQNIVSLKKELVAIIKKRNLAYADVLITTQSSLIALADVWFFEKHKGFGLEKTTLDQNSLP